MNGFTSRGSVVLCLALCAGLGACKKAEADSGSSQTAAPAATAAPAEGKKKVATGPKAPFESLTVKWTGKQSPERSPIFSVTNVSNRSVKVVFLFAYAYDKNGKQVGSHDLSYNMEIKPGESDENVVIGFSQWAPADATNFEAVFTGLKFGDEDKIYSEPSRAPAQRAMGAAPPAGGAAAAPAAAAPAAAAPATAGGSEYHVGDKVMVEWKGATYPASILKVAGPDLYLIHYDGYGHNWDETVRRTRITSRR